MSRKLRISPVPRGDTNKLSSRVRRGGRGTGFSPATTCVSASVLVFVSFFLVSRLRSQQPTPEAQQPPPVQSRGMATGGAHPPVRDALHRPITAGGFVDDAPVIFADVTHQSGLDKFRHRSGTPEKSTIIDAPGSGVALLDYDNDGWLDIYLVNGSAAAAMKGQEPPPRAMLFHNNHDGTFTDVTEKAGVANERWGFGAAVADYDNDGWPDIYVSNFGKNRLYHNNHDGTFTDVAEKAGVALAGWSTGATWGDYDRDGLLDLFVPGYVSYNFDRPVLAGRGGVPEGACQYRGVDVFCGPLGLIGEPDHLFHNKGDGTFTDVSVKAGVSDSQRRYGFSSVFVDLDDDGWPDLAVANDSSTNYLYHNRRDATFEDISYMSGFAVSEEGRAQASMGIAVGDYNRDGKLDLFITTFSDDNKTLYRNDGDSNFTDVSYRAGLGNPTIPFLSWGASFLDFDNDGLLDIFIANGHVYPIVDKTEWGTTYAQRPLLFRNLDGKKFVEAPAATNSGLATVVSARGAAFGDLFNDGHIDVVLNNIDSPPTLLRNVVHNTNHWLELKLVAQPLLPVPPQVRSQAPASKQLRVAANVAAADRRGHFSLAMSTSPARAAFSSGCYPEGPAQFSGAGGPQPPASATRNVRAIVAAADCLPRPPRGGGQLTLGANALPSPSPYKSPRDAIGAKVFLTAGGVRQRADVFSGGSYASTSDPRVHFGLGAATKVDQLEIHWPDGAIEQIPIPAVDRILTITEGKGLPPR